MKNTQKKRNILIYTFYNWNAISYKAVRALSDSELSVLFIRGKNGAARLAEQVMKWKYRHVLGLGDFRKDSKRIRIEEKFINRYGKRKISEYGRPYYYASWKLALKDDQYSSDKASCGPCNLSAYSLAEAIEKNKLSTKLSFVHIPKSYKKDKIENAVLTIQSWIKSISDRNSAEEENIHLGI